MISAPLLLKVYDAYLEYLTKVSQLFLDTANSPQKTNPLDIADLLADTKSVILTRFQSLTMTKTELFLPHRAEPANASKYCVPVATAILFAVIPCCTHHFAIELLVSYSVWP